MPSGRMLALVALVSTGLLASLAFGQATSQPAEKKGEELKSSNEPAPATGQTDANTPEGAKEGPGAEGSRPKAPSFFDNPILLIMLAFLVLLFFWSSRSRKKQDSKRQAMLAGLKRGDKVTSIGGIVGTVIEAREDEVVVKVDETNNVRMHFARWAIRGVGDEAKTEKPEDKK